MAISVNTETISNLIEKHEGSRGAIIAILEDFAEKVTAKGGSVTLVEFG